MDIASMLPIWIGLGFIAGRIADGKGRPFIPWVFLGFLCFPVAVIYLLVTGDVRVRKCPYCAEMVKEEAKICRYCGNRLPAIKPKH